MKVLKSSISLFCIVEKLGLLIWNFLIGVNPHVPGKMLKIDIKNKCSV